MKKRILALLLILSLCIQASAAFAGAGDASSYGLTPFILSPYVCDAAPTESIGIRTADDFYNMLNNPDGKYILLEDIDLGQWEPSEEHVFSGTLNGNGHTVSYSTSGKVDSSKKLVRGLFYALDCAFILNLRVRPFIHSPSGDINSTGFALGGLAAYSRGTTLIYNCVADVEINIPTVKWSKNFSDFEAFEMAETDSLESKIKNSASGGMIGIVEKDSVITMEYCRVNGYISNSHNVGGLIGQVSGTYCDLFSCENLADLTAISNVGGIIGNAPSASLGYISVSCSANCGDVDALSNFAGGIAGNTSGGSFYIADCINTGFVCAGIPDGSGYAGGIAGKYAGTAIRSINTGIVLSKERASLFPTGSNVTTDGNSLYCLTDIGNTLNTPEGILMTVEELQNDCEALDDIYVWMPHPETGIPYPRTLLGEHYDYYRAAYVQALRDVELYTDDFGVYLEVNLAGTLGEEFRKSHLNEVNNVWQSFEILNSITDFDLSAADQLSNYDVLLCDLMMQENFQSTYEALRTTGSMEMVSDSMNVFSNGSSFVDVASSAGKLARIVTEARMDDLVDKAINADSRMRSVYSLYTQTSHLPEYQRHVGEVMDAITDEYLGYKSSISALDTANSALDTANPVMGYVGSGLSAMNIFFNRMEQAAVEDMAEEIYVASYERFGDLLNDLAEIPTADYKSYPEPVDAKLNFELLEAALVDLNRDAFNRNNISESFQTAMDTVGSAATASAVFAGEAAAGVLTKAMADAKAYKVVSKGYGAAKLGAGVGILLSNELLGMHDIAHYSSMVNSAGYMSDKLLPLVKVEYAEFEILGTYEEAVEFVDAYSLYLNLQILACDYALSYSEKTHRDAETMSAENQLRIRRVELLSLLDQITHLV